MSLKTIRIEVTQEDIDRGEPGDNCACPIALAVLRATAPIRDSFPAPVQVDGFYVDFCTGFGADRISSQLPPECSEFVNSFDDRKPVQPFSFDLDLEVPTS